jgi:MFS family permease
VTAPARTHRMPPLVVTAMFIDALGAGLTAPFILLVGHVLVGLSLPVTGLAVAIGGFIGIAGGPIAGLMVDRCGAVRLVVAANLIGAVGNVGLMFSRDATQFLVASAVCAFAVRAFWSAFAPMVASLAAPEDQERWFGRLRGARYVGLTVGGAVASLALLAGEQTGLRLVLALDASSYVIAAVLVLVGVGEVRWSGSADHDNAKGSYATALADRGNVLLAVLNVLCTVLATAPLLALPVYALAEFPHASWLPGALFAVLSGALALVVSTVHRLTHGYARLRVLAAASVLWVAGCLGFAGVGAVPSGVGIALLFASAVLLGAAEGVYSPTADALPLVLAPPGHTGRYTALHQFAWGLSSVVSPMLASFLLEVGHDVAWEAMAGIAAAATLAYLAAGAVMAERVGVSGPVVPATARSPTNDSAGPDHGLSNAA